VKRSHFNNCFTSYKRCKCLFCA